MSTEIDTRDDDDAGLAKSVYRTVTPGYTSHSDDGMNAIGWAVFLGVVLLLVPLLPLIVVVWGVNKVIEAVIGDAKSEE
ncbi:hypothetical protein Hbl1158_04650 [Halobaculum sp. CBA1158]|uniref:DUF7535 family protein n=1 Tax=Halobaculum sp. CBA1158 TaxID=2904243 RepID=UPI001F3862EC|nr:hypothetical protein [Halobaculum sp. CBA1158]UIP00653.1 hypothetical protein Hbl1158_04650 [Halobaculum sp. CBA1158]